MAHKTRLSSLLAILVLLWACGQQEYIDTVGDTEAISGPSSTYGGTTQPAEEVSSTVSATLPVVEGPLRISGESDKIIQDIRIHNPNGDCVVIERSSYITLKNVSIGPCAGKAVVVAESSGVRVDGSTIADSSFGIYALSSRGVVVVDNAISRSGRHAVQFDKVSGAGNRIERNDIQSVLGASGVEDFISVFKSSGTADSPIIVRDNRIEGGGPSPSGAGILVGDYGGAHILVEGNMLTDPGQVGIGVAGGNDISVIGNFVSSQRHSWSNVGIYVWNQSEHTCARVLVEANEINWLNSEGIENPIWNGGGCGPVSGWDENA